MEYIVSGSNDGPRIENNQYNIAFAIYSLIRFAMINYSFVFFKCIIKVDVLVFSRSKLLKFVDNDDNFETILINEVFRLI